MNSNFSLSITPFHAISQRRMIKLTYYGHKKTNTHFLARRSESIVKWPLIEIAC
jgi:hypothetical protein